MASALGLQTQTLSINLLPMTLVNVLAPSIFY